MNNLVNESIELLEENGYEVTIEPQDFIGNKMCFLGHNLLIKTRDEDDVECYTINLIPSMGIRGKMFGMFKDYDPVEKIVTFHVDSYGADRQPKDFTYKILSIEPCDRIWKPGMMSPRERNASNMQR